MKKDNTWKIKIERIKRSKLWAADMSRIAVRILNYLEDNGKSQRWLADQLGVSPQQITKIVKGRQNLSWGKIKEIEEVIDIKLASIDDNQCSTYQSFDYKIGDWAKHMYGVAVDLTENFEKEVHKTSTAKAMLFYELKSMGISAIAKNNIDKRLAQEA